MRDRAHGGAGSADRGGEPAVTTRATRIRFEDRPALGLITGEAGVERPCLIYIRRIQVRDAGLKALATGVHGVKVPDRRAGLAEAQRAQTAQALLGPPSDALEPTAPYRLSQVDVCKVDLKVTHRGAGPAGPEVGDQLRGGVLKRAGL